jgi:uncharacterized protein YqeY
MSLVEELRAKLKEAMRGGAEGPKGILRVVLGEVSTLEGRQGKVSDEEVRNLVKKMIASNNEVIGITSRDPARAAQTATLEGENRYLLTLLPGLLTGEALRQKIEPLAEQIRAAKNEGQATGVVIRALKQEGADFLGDEVKRLVAELRG